ncbi:DUF4142 domain-containing protein [Myxococcus sp. K15C18031901]|uniref:DUF4142 domain-containing protein n=1 Tax=Myxococcus dinghuensis TaxID=2906761 RepID=UPI0020A71ABB|nr:DUF4142 domain-containing protein [Myxococcus dinghuensis]MCP3102055.1 DUF4142 domain-containing protein [Myxococcus dinghuensis]
MKGWMKVVLAGVCVLTAACTSESSQNEAESLNAQVVTLSDAQILRVLQVLNDGEVSLGKMGEGRATVASVKDFSTKMVNDHSAARQRLDTLASDQRIMPAESQLSVQLVAEVQGLMRVLGGLEGQRFDLAMMDTQLVVHGRAAMVLDAIVTPQVQDEALKEEAASERKEVQAHLEEALPIQKDLTGTL